MKAKMVKLNSIPGHRGLPLLLLLVGLLTLAALPSNAGGTDLTIIVNPAAPIDRVAVADLGDLLLDKHPGVPGISKAGPVVMAAGTPEHDLFLEKVLNMSERDWKRYWAKAIFNGQKTPPREAKSAEEVIAAVAGDPNGIGIVSGAVSDTRVKTIQLVP